MKMAWVLGWAVPESWFEPLARAAFPGATHICVRPGPAALADLTGRGPFDWIAGYSLGSLLLLLDPARAQSLGRVALLAPVFGFPSELGLGGRIRRVQVSLTARRLRFDAPGALAQFRALAGLEVADQAGEPDRLEDLLWGLERLEHDQVPPRLPAGWLAWCGEWDALLDAARLRELVPEVAVVPGATHHPASLLRAFAERTASSP